MYMWYVGMDTSAQTTKLQPALASETTQISVTFGTSGWAAPQRANLRGHQEPRRGLSIGWTGNPRPLSTSTRSETPRRGERWPPLFFSKTLHLLRRDMAETGACRDPPTHRLRIAPKSLVTLQVCAPKGQHKQN